MIEVSSCPTTRKLFTLRRRIIHPVDPQSMASLDRVFRRSLVCTEVTPAHRAHVSFIDLKSPQSIVGRLRSLGIRVAEGEVLEKYLAFEADLARLPKRGHLTTPESWDFFGEGHCLVARLPKDSEWMEYRRSIIELFEQVWLSFGLKDCLKDTEISGFKGRDFSPHITLGTGIKRGTAHHLAGFDIRDWQVTLQPAILKGSLFSG